MLKTGRFKPERLGLTRSIVVEDFDEVKGIENEINGPRKDL
jgi:hypothetical protein